MPDSGVVKIDGIDIRDYGVRMYRDLCAGVLQTDQLLSGTITDNITLFDDDVDHGRLQQAAERAQIGSFINALPMGYNSLVGDMGSIMSAGQRQRILLARAFYKNARILLLDEATANLDRRTADLILEYLASNKAAKVCVSHRDVLKGIATKTIVVGDGPGMSA